MTFYVKKFNRTDAGVHALINTAQVELEHPTDEFYDTETAIRRLNSWFARCGHEIRITSIYPVTDEFDPRRNAKSRSYFYRIMIAKDFNEHKVPISELQRAWHIRYLYIFYITCIETESFPGYVQKNTLEIDIHVAR